MARSRPLEQALVATDAALNAGLVNHGMLLRAVVDLTGAPRLGQVRSMVSLVDPMSESPLETLLRLLAHAAGLPPPLTQYVVRSGGRFIARVDFCWPEQRVIVQADGFAFHADRESYRRDREQVNAMVRLGFQVLRFTWEDVRHRPGQVVAAMRAVLRSRVA